MGQCSDRISEKAETTAHSVSVDRARHLSGNPATTASRYHCPLLGGRRLEDDYEVSSKVIGQGLCGEVVLAYSRVGRRKYALKRIRKKNVTWAKLQQLTEEVEIYLALDHPHIARLHNVYETEDNISLLTEYCEGGELYFSLQERGVYSDVDAAEAARQMLRAVGYLHAHKVVHRDLKLENFLYERKEADPNPHLKLIDFGFAKVWEDHSTKMTASCGSIAYVSPDVLLRRGYTDQCDLWSLGVILWMLLAGYPPFHGSEKLMMESIKAGRPDWSHGCRWKPVSEDALDLVKRLLTVDPQLRPCAAQALQHPWLARPAAPPSRPGGPILRSLRAYAAAPKVRRALLQLLVQELPSEETRDLRADFLALDRSNTGTIALCDLQDFLSTKDLASGEMSVQSPRSGDLSDIMAALDMNGDGQVYFSEFLAATVRPEQHAHEDAMQAAFVRLDADGSGTIDAYDLACVFGESFEGADVEELLTQADATGVGEIDYDAFVAVLLRGGGAEEDALAAPPAASTSSPRSPPATPSSASSGEVSPRSPGRSSMPSSSLGELASPAKPEDVFLEEVLSPGPKLLGGMQVGVKSPLPAVCLVDKGFPEKVLWRMPQSPLGGS